MIFEEQDLNTEILIPMCKFYASSAQINFQKKKKSCEFIKRILKV